MAFPNLSDLVTTTLDARSKDIADNVTKNNALLYLMSEKGNIKPVDGGITIVQELSFQENGNFGWYSGYDLLPVAAQDVLSAAQFAWKQAATPVVISGYELAINSGKEKVLDLLESRIKVAESTMKNQVTAGLYSDGTGFGGKQIAGLQAAVVTNPTTGTYGSIDRAVYPFWRNQTQASGGLTGSNIQAQMTTLWGKTVRGSTHPDAIMADSATWGLYMGSLQAQQRFTNEKMAQLGFTNIKFMTADVYLDGGIGGFMPANTMYFLNSDYLFLRPHKDRNFVPLSPKSRAAVNQDAEVQILGWMGNLAASGLQFQGILT